jgi:flavin reductase (DIM6/NTAB) family NADH-FMN oxidoreductase RutF
MLKKHSSVEAHFGEDYKAALKPYLYTWPDFDLANDIHWAPDTTGEFLVRTLPETDSELARDSRWPTFFPSPIAIVTVWHEGCYAIEKVVGPSIVNRFPYTLALSFCRDPISERHHPRRRFMEMLEAGGCVAVQFLPPGTALDRAMKTILEVPDENTKNRLDSMGLKFHPGVSNPAPVLEDAYLAYEAELIQPHLDMFGVRVNTQPWRDVGSHRLYFLEIKAIQLRSDIADGSSRIAWRSLPEWNREHSRNSCRDVPKTDVQKKYIKNYSPHYLFPSEATVAFVPDKIVNNMAIKFMPRYDLAHASELSNDAARWPCFFPSSVGMITSVADNGKPNLMPCGSTCMVSRHPLVIATCISYAALNERYAPRASLEFIRRNGGFACGVPYVDSAIAAAIAYCGNVSIASNPDKVAYTGLSVHQGLYGPVLADLPITFECRLVGEERLGTHVMLLGEVERILVRKDVHPSNPLNWFPWSEVIVD